MNPQDFSDQWPVITAYPDFSLKAPLGCPRFADVYFSREGGFFESEHVFVRPAGFQDRLAHCADPRVLELGFGTGRNFLTTIAYFLKYSPPDAVLHYLAFEQYPLDETALKGVAQRLSALSRIWIAEHEQFSAATAETLMAVNEQLHHQWPDPVPGFHRRILDTPNGHSRIRLTLVIGDANRWISQVDSQFDAVYLDGFAPSKNESLWRADLFRQLHHRAASGCQLMTYSAARVVRDHLNDAGFEFTRVPGYGRKRHSLIANKPVADESCMPLAERPTPVRDKSQPIAVIGAGFAGVSTARVLAQRGYKVDLYEQKAHPANGGSGNPAGLVAPVLSRDFNTLSRLTVAGMGLVRCHLQQSTPEHSYRFNGVYKLGRNDRQQEKQRTIAQQLQPDARFAKWARVVLEQEADWAWYFPKAGWLRPRAVIEHWLQTENMTPYFQTGVSRLEPISGGRFCLYDNADTALGCYSSVVLACANQTQSLVPELGRWLEPCRGQLTLAAIDQTKCLQSSYMREGYVIDLPEGKRLFGASFKPGCDDIAPRAEEDTENHERLAEIHPQLADSINENAFEHRVSVRATTPDRLPMVGQIAPGLYLHTGHGARGLTWSLLLSEYLAGLINAEPSPLALCDQKALDPHRFDERAARKAARCKST